MRTIVYISAVIVSGLLVAGAASAQDCEVTCAQECRQEAAQCAAEVAFEMRAGKFTCASDFDNAKLECEADALEARGDCVGMCGIDVRECLAESKAAFKECKGAAREDFGGCLVELAGIGSEGRAECATDAADCLDLCDEPV